VLFKNSQLSNIILFPFSALIKEKYVLVSLFLIKELTTFESEQFVNSNIENSLQSLNIQDDKLIFLLLLNVTQPYVHSYISEFTANKSETFSPIIPYVPQPYSLQFSIYILELF